MVVAGNETRRKGEYRWVHARRLYRDWGSMKLCFKVFSLIPVGAFVFFTMFFPAKPGQRMAMRQLPAADHLVPKIPGAALVPVAIMV